MPDVLQFASCGNIAQNFPAERIDFQSIKSYILQLHILCVCGGGGGEGGRGLDNILFVQLCINSRITLESLIARVKRTVSRLNFTGIDFLGFLLSQGYFHITEVGEEGRRVGH